jgi:sugar phosphate isomerase/epimerase
MKHLKLIILFTLVANFAYSQEDAKVGVQLYSFRNQFSADLRSTFESIKALGIKKVECAGFYSTDAAGFKKLTDEFGMTVEGVSADFGKLQDPEKLKKIINDAKTLNAKNVVCFWVPHNEPEFTLENTISACDVFNKAGKVLAENGLSLLYHPHGYEFRPYKDRYLMDEFMTRCNPKYINFEMDILWTYHPGHNPVVWLKKYPTRYKALHIKDRRKGVTGNQNGRMDTEDDVTLGTGDLNVEDILAEAKKMNIKYLYLEDESARSFQQVPNSIKFK